MLLQASPSKPVGMQGSPWSVEEIIALAQFACLHGSDWVKVAQQLKEALHSDFLRSPDACQKKLKVLVFECTTAGGSLKKAVPAASTEQLGLLHDLLAGAIVMT